MEATLIDLRAQLKERTGSLTDPSNLLKQFHAFGEKQGEPKNPVHKSLYQQIEIQKGLLQEVTDAMGIDQRLRSIALDDFKEYEPEIYNKIMAAEQAKGNKPTGDAAPAAHRT